MRSYLGYVLSFGIEHILGLVAALGALFGIYWPIRRQYKKNMDSRFELMEKKIETKADISYVDEKTVVLHKRMDEHSDINREDVKEIKETLNIILKKLMEK